MGTWTHAHRTGESTGLGKLPKAYQEMFRSCQSANLLMLSRYDRLNAVALER